MTINDHVIEYVDDGHIYLVDGVIVPSITQLLKPVSSEMYKDVPRSVLDKAAERGTMIHKAIEEHDDSIPEARNFRWVMEKKHCTVEAQEIVVMLEEPLACGRLDLVLMRDGKLGIADIKTTSSFQKEYVGLQLNLYRLAYQQSYHRDIEWLAGIHLRGNTRKMHMIPINEDYTYEYLKEKSWI